MKKLGVSLMGLVLTAMISSHAVAATTAPDSHEPKPSATSGPSPVPETPVAPAPSAPATAPAAPAAPAPAKAAPTVTATESATAAKDTCKIGYVDMTRIGQESPAGKAASASIKAKSAKLKSKIEARQKQLEKEKAALEAKVETFSVKERQAKAKEFQKKVEEYQKLLRSSDEEMSKMQDKLTNELFKKIKKAAAGYAKTNGYTMIVEEKAVVYAADALEPKDITDEISALVKDK